MTKKKLYELTPEHREHLAPWAAKWIANAMSTKAMDDSDKAATIAAINGMYDAAKLERPKNIVFAPSPLVIALAGPISAGVWHLRRNQDFARALLGGKAATEAATSAATEAATSAAAWAATSAAAWAATADATWAATRTATEAATRTATSAATSAATWAATRAATEAATRAATSAAAWAATEAATRAATSAAAWAATRTATEAATRTATSAATWAATSAATEDAKNRTIAPMVRWLIGLTGNYYNLWNGGNQWSGWCAFLSFFKHVAKLDLPVYEKWQHYEAAAIHSGPRVMTPDFVIVSDRPAVLKVDSQNRPHCADGPSHVWRDGWSLYYYHGVAIPKGKEWILIDPERVTVAAIDAEANAEVRRVMVEKFGTGRYLIESGARELQRDEYGILYSKQVGNDTILSVRVLNSTPEPDGQLTGKEALKIFGKPRWWKDGYESQRFKNYFLDVHPDCRPLLDPADGKGDLGEPQELTAHNAVAASFGLRGSEYAPECET